jgi:protein HOOK3
VVLQHLLDDANRLKNQFEKNYLEVSQERDILQSDMARIRQGIPDSIVDQNEHTLSLRLHSIDLEKQIKSLTETVAKLEQRLADGKYYGTEDDIRSKYDEMDKKSKSLEEQTKKQLQDINKLLLEKDLLQGQSIEQKDLLLEKERLNSEMKASLAAFEAKDDEPFKQQNAHLQQQTIQLQEQLHELKTKLKKLKEVSKKKKICFPFLETN